MCVGGGGGGGGEGADMKVFGEEGLEGPIWMPLFVCC